MLVGLEVFLWTAAAFAPALLPVLTAITNTLMLCGDSSAFVSAPGHLIFTAVDLLYSDPCRVPANGL